jgi:cGMP-dependent protein kinase
MAPEVILGEGYSCSIDVWSVSVCIYEFVCGAVPFGDNYDDPMDIYTAIVKDELKFPNFVKDNVFKHAMKSLLKKNLVSRLCTLDQIKGHPWLEGFDWVNNIFFIKKLFRKLLLT